MIRTIFVWSCIVLFGCFFGLLAILSYPFDQRGDLAIAFAKSGKGVSSLPMSVRVEVEGLRTFHKGSPYIFYVESSGEL